MAISNKQEISLYKRLPKNTEGRDFVVGDLHGCRSELEKKMFEVNFDSSKDRIICVGDLVDRGEESLRTLALLREPWFFSVLSNHESMLLTYSGRTYSRHHSPNDFIRNGGDWVNRLSDSETTGELEALLDIVMELPLMLIVDGSIPFNVIHGDLLPIGFIQKDIESSKTISRVEADSSVWSRDLIQTAGGTLTDVDLIEGREVILSDEPLLKGLNITFVGHTILKKIVVHNSHVYIDQGAYQRVNKGNIEFGLTMLDANKFCRSLTSLLVPVHRSTP
jgi:serine/threonine protein phosphatase 1